MAYLFNSFATGLCKKTCVLKPILCGMVSVQNGFSGADARLHTDTDLASVGYQLRSFALKSS